MIDTDKQNSVLVEKINTHLKLLENLSENYMLQKRLLTLNSVNF